MKSITKAVFCLSVLSFTAIGLSACSPEAGSKEWCEELKEKNKGDWSTNEVTEFAKSCVFK